MIKKKDVVIMRIPFPEINSYLAKVGHMYFCLESKHPKKFIKCQTANVCRMEFNRPPYKFVIVMPDIRHSPFIKPTLLDCDKFFSMDKNIAISEVLLTTRRRDISEELFGKLEDAIKHDEFKEIVLDAIVVVQLNDRIELM